MSAATPSAARKASRARLSREGNAQRLGKVLDFMRLLWGLAHALESQSKRMAVELGVTGPQRLVIRILGRFPSSSAGELATLLYLHPSTLTGVLARLQMRGLIARRIDPQDRRRSMFRLTARGKRVDRARAGTVEGALQSALAQVSQRDLEAATRVLGALVAELERR